MTTLSHTTGQHNWEDLLEYATEAISEYLWALEVWQQQEQQDYSPGFLLQDILASRARGRQALSLMATAPTEYQDDYRRLQLMWQQAEQELQAIVQKQKDWLTEVINQQWLQTLQQAEAELLRVRALVQDAFLLEDEEWGRHEREEAAAAFLSHWLDLSLCRQELEREPLQEIPRKAFQEQFDRVNGLLRQYFDYFGFFQEAFRNLAATEYLPELWWLKQLPEARDVAELEAQDLEALEQLLAQAFAGRAVTGPCSRAEEVIAYTLEELSPEECREIREHLMACGYCFDLMLDIRLAESQAVMVPRTPLEELGLPLPATAPEATESAAVPDSRWRQWLDTLPNQLRDIADKIGASLGNLAETNLKFVQEMFNVAQFQVAFARQTLGGAQPAVGALVQCEHPLWGRLQEGRRGGYPLLTQNQSDSPAYRQLYDALNGRQFYWKVWAFQRTSGARQQFPHDDIGKAFMGPCHILPPADYALVVLALATERDKLEQFIARVEAGEAAPEQPAQGVAVIFFTPETQQESDEQV